MDTKRWYAKDLQQDEQGVIRFAAELLKAGEAVAFPTETVYGLGADATNEMAINKIFQAKGRPQDNPLIVHVATAQQLKELVSAVPAYVDKLIEAFTPGPLTFVLPSNGRCAQNVTAGLDSVGVRLPGHPLALKLLEEAAIPVAAPSANLSGKPSPTTADHVWSDLNGRISAILDGGATGVGLESTVLDCTQAIPIILRPGGITKEQLEEVVGTVMVDPGLANEKEHPKSPGMKYKHYSPDAPLWIVKGSAEKLQQVIDTEKEKGHLIGVMAASDTVSAIRADVKKDLGGNMGTVASTIYDALREFNKHNVDLIICESFSEEGIGQAVMNRLKKAASQYIQ
ncbi:L-threonylcarbamoyladenylate synthase [Oceanobacillus manasiensis]|uniref:L-threonylcarbamoyladenylate synthase n=1 Tax=Oceanobacillus manasiensis TaxID=586413 RepID=UPI0005A7A49E|nr:L-threonylcarbamoyladenylate synthase [Oceanobacillus manasiensis]